MYFSESVSLDVSLKQKPGFLAAGHSEVGSIVGQNVIRIHHTFLYFFVFYFLSSHHLGLLPFRQSIEVAARGKLFCTLVSWVYKLLNISNLAPRESG